MHPQKKSQVEVKSGVESYRSGNDGWRVWGLHNISFTLLGLKENMEDWNGSPEDNVLFG